MVPQGDVLVHRMLSEHARRRGHDLRSLRDRDKTVCRLFVHLQFYPVLELSNALSMNAP